MDVFEYVAVMVTVVLALGLSHVLSGVASMLAMPDRVKVYWVHLLWAFSLLALHLQAWLVLWTRRHQSEFPVMQVAMMLLAAALIFISARVLVPGIPASGNVDLREHFFKIRVPLFATLTVFWIFPTLGTLLFTDISVLDSSMLVRFALMALSVFGLLLAAQKWQEVIAVLWALLLVSHMALIGPHLTTASP